MFFLYLLQACLYLVMYTFILITLILLGFKLYSNLTKTKCKSKARLHGKVILITGGTSGIGLETAKDLAGRGARVIIASWDVQKSAMAVEEIKAETGNDKVEYRYLDLSKFSNVRKFVEEFNATIDRLDVLINNAGVVGLKHRLTEDGINITTQINYFGPFLLTNLLMDKLIASKPSRIVIVSSFAHYFPMLDLTDLRNRTTKPWYTLYANSKMCNVLWAKALARKLPDGVTANVLHPGVVKTEIFNQLVPLVKNFIPSLIGAVFMTAKEAAQTTIHLAVAEELQSVSGKYFTDCRVKEESKIAKNEDLIEKVWQESLVITNSKWHIKNAFCGKRKWSYRDKYTCEMRERSFGGGCVSKSTYLKNEFKTKKYEDKKKEMVVQPSKIVLKSQNREGTSSSFTNTPSLPGSSSFNFVYKNTKNGTPILSKMTGYKVTTDLPPIFNASTSKNYFDGKYSRKYKYMNKTHPPNSLRNPLHFDDLSGMDCAGNESRSLCSSDSDGVVTNDSDREDDELTDWPGIEELKVFNKWLTFKTSKTSSRVS